MGKIKMENTNSSNNNSKRKLLTKKCGNNKNKLDSTISKIMIEMC